MAVAPAPTTTTTPPSLLFNEEKPIEQLSTPIILSEQILNSINHTISFNFECLHISKLVDTISTKLRTLVRISTTIPTPLYDRPIHRITADVTRTLHRALSLIRRCRRRSFLHRIIRMITVTDFRKVFILLDSSIGDLQWLVSILELTDNNGNGRGIILSLPPIASNDPILSWVWSYIACVQMGCMSDRIEAASELCSLANDSDRTKKMIVEEGGVMPLLRLLKEESNPAAQTASAVALFNIVNDVERVRIVVDCMGVPLIVQVLNDATIGVQVRVAELVSRMAEFDSVAKEEFARENVIRPLVSLLSFETFDLEFDPRRFSFHSIVEINKEKEKNERSDLLKLAKPRLNSSFSSVSFHSSEGGSSRGHNRKDRENASVEMKRELKISCSRALWMLAKDSVSNSRRITETKGLLCLAKLIEKEQGVLQMNCLMAIMEITLAADLNPDLRRSAFKTNSHAAKAVVDQLIGIVTESNDPTLQIPALRSIGCLSRTFPARETRVINPLVDQLSNVNYEVATEAAIALGKFACPDNFLCQEHSKSIIEFNGVLPLMRLLRAGERGQVHGLILLCYLAIHASKHEVLEQARVLNALEGADRTIQFAQQPHLRDMISKAIYHLNLYRNDIHPLKQPSIRIY